MLNLVNNDRKALVVGLSLIVKNISQNLSLIVKNISDLLLVLMIVLEYLRDRNAAAHSVDSDIF